MRWTFARRVERCLLALATLIAGTPAVAEDCQPKQLAWLDLSFTESGAPLVPIQVAGKEARMLVDTGAYFSFLTENFLKDVEGERHEIKLGDPVRYHDAAGNELRDYVVVRGVTIGNWYTRPDRKVDFLIVSDAMMANSPGETMDGILGLNILKAFFDIELDLMRGKIGFFRPDQCLDSDPVYWAKQFIEIPLLARRNPAIVRVKLDGREFTALIDTGASISILDEDAAAKVFDLSKKKAGEHGEAIAISGQGVKGRWHGFNSMTLSGIEVAQPDIFVMPVGSKEHSMVLGRDLLSKYRLFFGFRRDILYATPAKSASAN
jgi:predicted aspartyl protease